MSLEAETAFGLNFLNTLPANESIVFSPLSIALALSLVQVGAKGATKQQITNAVLKGANDDEFVQHFANLSEVLRDAKNGVQTNIANRIFVNEQFEIKQDYLDFVKKEYEASAESLNFTDGGHSAKIVNEFVNDTTHGKIPELVTPEQFEGVLALLINAVYFNAKWSNRFCPSSSYDSAFNVSQNESKQIVFMRKYLETEEYASDDLFEVLSLPYEDLSYSFAIFLPKQRFGLGDAIQKLDSQRFQSLLTGLHSTLINYRIPKIKITKNLELKNSLEQIGISTVFTDNADLSGISANIKVSDGIHKALIEVDENGTVAAAATDIRAVPMSAPVGEPIEFNPDHPFLFALLKDNHPLFLGTFYG